MKLSVVILNWNAAEDTEHCIRLVEAWGSKALVPRPIIWVVDNGSRKPGVERLKLDHPEVRFLVSDVNLGFAGGSNLGIEAALELGSDAILLLNNDASVDEESVASMLSTLTSDPQIGVVGATLWQGARLLTAGGRDIARHAATHVLPKNLPSGLLDVDYVPGTVALIDRRVFQEVGLLDDDYFFGGEMADLCLRARRQGFRCVTETRARASHDLDRSFQIRATLHIYYVFRNRFLYIRKHYPRQRAWLYTLWILRGAYAAVVALAKGNWRRARAVGLGLVDGLIGRFGGQNDRVLR